MSVEKKEKLTLTQRLRRLLLGKEKPNLATRLSVNVAFGVWVYLASWQVLTFMVLMLMNSLEDAAVIEGAFNRLGSKMYRFTNTVELLSIHNLVQLGIYWLILVSLILIYRKKRIGFLLYVIGNVSLILSTILIMGLKYFQTETSYSYLILIGVTTIYFAIGTLWFYRSEIKKSLTKSKVQDQKVENEVNPPQQS